MLIKSLILQARKVVPCPSYKFFRVNLTFSLLNTKSLHFHIFTSSLSLQMQQRGQPPQEIIDELAPGMTFGPDGLPTGLGGAGLGGLGGLGGNNEGPMDPNDCCIQ